jgi:hypothetical protein
MEGDQNARYLDLLSVFHYIYGGITALFSCVPFLHLAIGVAIVSGAMDEGRSGAPPRLFGFVFILMAAIFIILGWSLAICEIIAGYKLKRRKSHMFCVVVAAVECVLMPLGTVLGVFTILLLQKESVKNLFSGAVSDEIPPNVKKPPTVDSEA